MMAETSWCHQSVITARKWFKDNKLGNVFDTEAVYHHPHLKSLFFDEKGNRSWGCGLPRSTT